jgi:hypothetical protein
LYNENNKFLSQLKLISSVFKEDELERSPTKEYCEENEKITRKLILSVIFIYEKYGRR